MVTTGDNLVHMEAVDPALEAYGDLLDVPGVFVFGSNDYFAPTTRNPVKYLLPDDGRHTHTPPLPWRDLRDGFEKRGWVDLTNRRATLEVAGTGIAFAGVDDPHLGYDDLGAVAGPADATADLRVGVAHAPYLRVLDQYADDGYDLLLAGHTHGGQLCLPVKGALVTNCDLDTARAKGLHRHKDAWLHRLGRTRDVAVRPGPVLLQTRGDPADAHRPSRFHRPGLGQLDSPTPCGTRAVAQLGSARSGRRGRRFKSLSARPRVRRSGGPHPPGWGPLHAS